MMKTKSDIAWWTSTTKYTIQQQKAWFERSIILTMTMDLQPLSAYFNTSHGSSLNLIKCFICLN